MRRTVAHAVLVNMGEREMLLQNQRVTADLQQYDHQSDGCLESQMKRKAKTHDSTHLTETHHIGAGLVRQVCIDCAFMSIQDSTEQFQVGRSGIPAWMDALADKFSMSVAS